MDTDNVTDLRAQIATLEARLAKLDERASVTTTLIPRCRATGALALPVRRVVYQRCRKQRLPTGSLTSGS